eukprot:CAMPEP_0184672790 /NCGR_PEP_ID=MMETSP0308-20130426/86305_1 /TAXON_ID=38269 /ORGANISM="Gloeochaete witrockiana, Strain SAG 46.84" /LENGTH=115 /DNA_ID=CAMNT_0027120177 /DNA_START=92 /DNA_END=439 /DNA_ORIENTATION=-
MTRGSSIHPSTTITYTAPRCTRVHCGTRYTSPPHLNTSPAHPFHTHNLNSKPRRSFYHEGHASEKWGTNSMGPEQGQDDGVDVGEEVDVLDGVCELDGALVAVSAALGSLFQGMC